MQIQVPQVSPAEAKRFSQVWNFNGVALVIDDAHCKFAADFANAVLRSFVQQQMAEAKAAAQPKVAIVED